MSDDYWLRQAPDHWLETEIRRRQKLGYDVSGLVQELFRRRAIKAQLLSPERKVTT